MVRREVRGQNGRQSDIGSELPFWDDYHDK